MSDNHYNEGVQQARNGQGTPSYDFSNANANASRLAGFLWARGG